MTFIMDPTFWVSLLTLMFLEIILGIDNLVFISIASNKVSKHQQETVRNIGLWIAFLLRAIMLAGLVWISKLSITLFVWPEFIQNFLKDNAHNTEIMSVTAKDMILFLGGLFLLAKGTWEIHEALEGKEEEKIKSTQSSKLIFISALIQIIIINLVFSLDSIITAIGMTDNLIVMLLAILIATFIMMFSVKPVSDFIEKHPTTKLLALSFILLIGVALIADALGFHIPRGYLYFAIAFSLFVEFLNILARKHQKSKK